jgi:hypothetical protein
MAENVILWPVLAMIGLTFAVWLTMFHRRVGEMRRRRIGIERLASSADLAALLEDRRAADNFRNLFELPALFHAAALAALATDSVDEALLVPAWAFVAFRVVHSAVHCTYNRVLHRFVAYFLSAIALWAMWIRLALAWFA